MSAVVERAEAWQAALEGAGLRVAFDTRNMNPPCVIITPPDITYPGVGSYRLEWSFSCVVPPPGNLDAWAKLDEMLDTLRAVLPLTVARPRVAFTTGDGTPLPSYEVRFTEYVQHA